jgi:hypothetical protein
MSQEVKIFLNILKKSAYMVFVSLSLSVWSLKYEVNLNLLTPDGCPQGFISFTNLYKNFQLDLCCYNGSYRRWKE